MAAVAWVARRRAAWNVDAPRRKVFVGGAVALRPSAASVVYGLVVIRGWEAIATSSARRVAQQP